MINIFVFGCGMYVCGSSIKPEGPVLSSIANFISINEARVNLFFILKNNDSVLRSKKRLDKSLAFKNICGNKNVKTDLITEDKLFENPGIFKLSSSINMALICSPDYCHFQQIKWALSYFIPTLVMKPPVCNLKELDLISELSEANQTPCFVEFHKRWDPQFQFLKQKIKSSKKLKIHEIVIEYGQPASVVNKVFSTWDNISDPFTYIGCHYVDLISFLFNASPKKVEFSFNKEESLIKAPTKADAVHGKIFWLSDDFGEFCSNIFANWIEPSGSDAVSRQQLSILTNKWRFEGDQKKRGLKLTDEEVKQINPHYINEIFSHETNQYYASGYAIDSILGFLINCNSQSEIFKMNSCTIQDSRSTMQVLEELQKSFIN